MDRIRTDILDVIDADFETMSKPGATLTGEQRVDVAAAGRGRAGPGPLGEFARHLYSDPGTVTADDVAAVAVNGDYGPVVETIGIISRLSAADRFFDVLSLESKPLPEPAGGSPTGNVDLDLKKRRAHVPMPPGAIPFALDLVPSEGVASRAMFGPLYMTENEMGDPLFGRSPGLNTAQLETVAARISLINLCFY